MKCPVCDAQVADNAKFCGVCGTPMPAAPVAPQPVQAPPVQQQWNNNPVQPSQNQFYGGQPNMPQNSYYPPNQPGFAAPNLNAAGKRMGWQKFSTSFILFLCAFFNLCLGITFVTGDIWEISDVPADFVYLLFDEIETADKLYGILLFATVVIQILARFQLAGYKKGANIMAVLACAIPFIASLIYVVMTFGITEEIIDSTILPFAKIFVGFFSTIFNLIYYSKRKNMYIN